MTHEIDHIWCGGAGEQTGEKTIVIWTHTVLDVAVKADREALAELIGAQKAKKYSKRIDRFFEDLYEDLADDGVPVHSYEPHAQNLA